MANVYLALKKSVVFVLLLLCQAAFTQPVINSFSPTSAWPGLPVSISGSGFSPVAGNNIVYFGPVRATVQTASTNTLNVTVPVGATYAPITVTVNGLTAYSRLPFNVRFQNFNTTLDTNDFGSKKDVYGFNNGRSVTLADLNNDGKADLFVTNQGNNFVTVLRNTSVPGTVSFAPNKNFPGGPGAFGSAAGDFDGDGKLDIAFANINNGLAGSVQVFRNNSINDTIRFDTTRYATGNGTSRVAIADVDRDGKPDLLALSINSFTISVFRNTTTTVGAISFAPKFDLTVGFGAHDLSVEDIDGDGKADIVTTYGGTNSGVSVWRNLSTPGSISFAARLNFPTFVSPNLVKVGDLNNDGKPDVLVTNYAASNLSSFRNVSTPGSIAFDIRQDIATGLRPLSISIADYNGDGRPDVAVGCDTPRAICIHPGIWSDSIRFGPRVDYKIGSNLSGIASGDIDGDGEIDLAFTNYLTAYAVSILRNKQNGESPIINSFTPTSAGTGTFVTIFGKYLSTASSVKFGSQWSDSVHVVSDSVVQARVYKGATGNITLYTQYGVATKPGFTYIPDTTNIPDTTCPVITSFWPTSGQQGTAVYILGSNFTGSSGVRFGGVLADSIVIMSDTMIKAIVDTGATGNVQVISPYCSATKPGFTFIGDTTNIPDTTCPVIKSFSPSSGPRGTAVYIIGSKFTGSTGVRFGGVPADSIVIINDTLIKAIVDTGATGSVQVINPYCVASKSGFTFIRDTIPPDTSVFIVSNFSPKSGKKGTVVTILGSGFNKAWNVLFGGVSADSIKVLSDTTIRAVVGNGASGAVSVIATNGIRSLAGFTYIVDTTCPVIKSFSPSSGPQGTAVYIIGSKFTGSTGVRFGGILADSVVIINDTLIKAIVDTGATGSVQVINPYCVASKPGFTFIRDTIPPDTSVFIVSNFSPKSGKKGTVVTILGSGFNKAWNVLFGGVSADSIKVLSDTTIRAVVGNGASGAVSVVATNGIRSLAGFTYIVDTACPVIKSFSPSSGPQGTAVYIIGSKFTGSTGVRFGGVPADSVVIINDTLIKAIVDTGATGSVQVISPYCSVSKPGFTYIADTTNIPDTTAPVISSFWPTSGTRGTTIFIWGSRFTGATSVRFGGVPADSIRVMSDTLIKAIVDTGATGSVHVYTPAGYASKPGFTYISDTTINDTLLVNARTAGANGIIQKSFKLYPNPASKYVTWQQPLINHKTHLQLIDMSGRIIKQWEVGSNTPQTAIPLQGLHTGVYKLVYIDGKEKITSTLLIK